MQKNNSTAHKSIAMVIGLSLLVFCNALVAPAFSRDFKINYEELKKHFMNTAGNEFIDNKTFLQRQFEEDSEQLIFRINVADREHIQKILNHNKRNKFFLSRKKLNYLAFQTMPATETEYIQMSKDIKRYAVEQKPYEIQADKGYELLPEPRYLLTKYNIPAGSRNIDLRQLIKKSEVHSIGVLSPTKDRLAYSAVYYDTLYNKVSSEVFIIKTDRKKDELTLLRDTSLMNSEKTKIMATGLDEEYDNMAKTLTIVDWSADGQKLAIKERIGSTYDATWQTNLWIYNFNTNKAKKLDEVRQAIRYTWMKDYDFDPDNYRWDIVPMGWDFENPNRFFVCAYAYTKNQSSKFLGVFSLDINGIHTKLESLSPKALNIGIYGLMLTKEPI